METIDYFKHCNLDGLDKSDVKLRYFRENSLICCADELPRKLYIIRQGKAKVYRRVNSDEFIVAGVLTGGAGFGFNLTATRDDELYLVSHGCEIIVLDAAIFERMRNLKVNANLTLLTGETSIDFGTRFKMSQNTLEHLFEAMECSCHLSTLVLLRIRSDC